MGVAQLADGDGSGETPDGIHSRPESPKPSQSEERLSCPEWAQSEKLRARNEEELATLEHERRRCQGEGPAQEGYVPQL